MTFDPVLPPLVLGITAVAIIALRLVALGQAVRSGSGRNATMRWCGVTSAVLLILIAAARPGTGPIPGDVMHSATRGGANVYFVVDRSADSAIGDYGGRTRMSGIRDDIQTLIESHPGARFAVISFASRPLIDWPLSNDAWSLEPAVAALNPHADGAAAGSLVNAGAAANVLRYQLIAAGQQYPQSKNLVYYFGSGAGRSGAPQGVFDAGAVAGGAVFGYGGGPALDEVSLRRIAEQLGLAYVQRAAGAPLPQAATAAGPPTATSPSAPRRVESFWVFTTLASLLLLVEVCFSARDLRRARSIYREVLT